MNYQNRSMTDPDLHLLQRLATAKQTVRKPVPLFGADLISFFKQSEKRHNKFGKLSTIWSQLVPEMLNDHCCLDTFTRGTLTVLVDSSSHLYELKQLLLAGLQAQILSAGRSSGLRKITLRQGRLTEDNSSSRGL